MFEAASELRNHWGNDGIQIATRSTDHRGRRDTAELAVRSSASASTSDRRYNGIVRIRIGPATYLRSVNGRLTDGGGPTPFGR
jgi:hypothetical protein